MTPATLGRIVLCSIILCTLVSGQGRSNGISKYTRGQSDPRTCLAFFEKYLNATETSPPSECPNGKCECGTQGRSQIAGSGGKDFGLHAINCSFHPYGQHSLEDIENMQTAEINDFKDGYTQHLDSHLGVWVSNLATTMNNFQSDSVPHYAMTWSVNNGPDYYSVMVQACGGFYIEFLSDRADGIEPNKFHKAKESRFDFSNFSRPSRDYQPIKVSRATTKIDAMISFFTETIGGSLIKNETVNGVQIARIKMNDADIDMQFVNRPPLESAKFTVEDLENYVNSVHEQYVKSTKCGFDQFGDHHWAYDSPSHSGSVTLSDFAKRLDADGVKYRWFGIDFGSFTGYQIYAFDPSGWTFQLDYPPGDNVPDEVATYSPSCKSNDGCNGQGLCDSGLDLSEWESFEECGHQGDACDIFRQDCCSGYYCGKNGGDTFQCNYLYLR